MMRRSSALAASRTGLPPSPEVRSLPTPNQGPALDELSLLGPSALSTGAPSSSSLDGSSNPPLPWSRLRSISKYESFGPSALAVSSPLLLSATLSDAPSALKPNSSSHSFTSLGALSGMKGVALFRVSSTQKPLLVLNCHAPTTIKNNQNESNDIRSMVFQPPPSRHNNHPQYHSSSSLALAAVRGNGILVWDVSGHSLNPLTARMGGHNETAKDDSTVQSLSWYMGDSAGNLLASATSSYACLWDLRESSSSSFAKPSLRFGGSGSSAGGGRNLGATAGCDYIQLACSTNSSDCALLGANGFVQVFDIRMVQQHRNSHSPSANTAVGGAHDQFRAHDGAGIGIAVLPPAPMSTVSSCRWVTWGIDSEFNTNEDPVVRIWETINATNSTGGPMEGETSAGPSLAPPEPRSSLKAECQVPNLACARAFGSESVVTVSQDAAFKWNVDLWKLSTVGGPTNSVLAKSVSFRAGQEANQKASAMLGQSNNLGFNLGKLIAVELAATSAPRLFETNPPQGSKEEEEEEGYSMVQKEDDSTVVVLGLTETGFLTSHMLPEAVPESMKKAYSSSKGQPANLSDTLRSNLSPHHKVRIFPENRESALGDIAGAWNEERVNLRETSSGQNLLQSANAPSSGDGQMQFDFDVTGVYSSVDDERAHFQAGMRKNQDKAELIRSTQSGESGLSSRASAAELMDKIETQNIPCPRMCGATFGPGVGGLVSFNNGEVKRMWKWFRGDVPRRQLSRSAASSISEREQTATSEGAPVVQDTVRTLKDLFDMMKASKESQWGADHDNSEDASSATSARPGDNFFEDEDSGEDEDDSSDFGDSTNDFLLEKVTDHKADDGSDPKINQRDTPETATGENNKSSGPSSDVLSPHVSLNQYIDVTSFNHQSPALATMLKLGSWVAESIDNSPADSLRDPSHKVFVLNSNPKIQNEQRLGLAVPGSVVEPESSVHAGAYGVRPGMQEPVDFLKKLFSHQQQGADFPGYSGLMLPPDKRLLPSAKGPARFRHAAAPDALVRAPRQNKPGVYTRRRACTWSKGVINRLMETRHLCSHNANVCRMVGDPSKASIWDVIEQIVDGRLIVAQSKTGVWNTKAGDTLASNFLSNTLRFLEYKGDTQMLATIVCVLRTEIQDLPKNEQGLCVFLPVDNEGRYDSYIQMYSRILYAWRLLSVHSEVKKHLSPQCRDDPYSTEFTALALPSQCISCGEKNSDGSSVCSSCNAFVFRCIVCENAVRGFFTYCLYCGHGGHASHLSEYFQLRQECPTGCGCKCVFGQKTLRTTVKRTSRGTLSKGGRSEIE